MTQRDIEIENKVYRGELRWRGDRWVESQPYDYVQREDRAKRMLDEVKLPGRVRELPDARDVIPNIGTAEIDWRKFNDYSMNPQHPGNGGKADGWRALGYQVDDPGDRIIPAGTKGVVLEVYSDGTCYVEFTFRPQTSDEDGDFLQAEVSPDQLETAGT